MSLFQNRDKDVLVGLTAPGTDGVPKKKKRVRVHRAVMEAFAAHRRAPRNNTVDHRNGNRADDSLGNLRWAAFTQQAADRELHAFESEDPVNEVDIATRAVTKHASVKAAADAL